LGMPAGLGRFHPRWRRAAREAVPDRDSAERFLAAEA